MYKNAKMMRCISAALLTYTDLTLKDERLTSDSHILCEHGCFYNIGDTDAFSSTDFAGAYLLTSSPNCPLFWSWFHDERNPQVTY